MLKKQFLIYVWRRQMSSIATDKCLYMFDTSDWQISLSVFLLQTNACVCLKHQTDIGQTNVWVGVTDQTDIYVCLHQMNVFSSQMSAPGSLFLFMTNRWVLPRFFSFECEIFKVIVMSEHNAEWNALICSKVEIYGLLGYWLLFRGCYNID